MGRARNANLLGKITITILVMVGLCVNTALALDGSGTEEDPWLIQSLGDFNDFAADANYWDDYTRLETDVNLAGRVYERAVIAWDVNDARSGFQGTEFTGVFDGAVHKIYNLSIDTVGIGIDYLGLFGIISGEQAQVKNLGIENASISGSFIVGYSECVGGLCGENDDGTINNCYATGSINMAEASGGLCGWNKGTIINCYAAVALSAGEFTGGLCGANGEWTRDAPISNCYATGSVSGWEYLGGLCGWSSDSTINNCYATGSVSGDDYLGGLLGCTEGGTISNCYSIGSIIGDNSQHKGGLVGGWLEFRRINDCFWDTETSGMDTSSGGEPRTTSQLHHQSTFTDWDFINVWNIGENQTYPYLRTYLTGDINKDGIVNFLDFAITANQWMEGQ